MKRIILLFSGLLFAIEISAAIYHTYNAGYVNQLNKWKDDANNVVFLNDPALLKNNSYTIYNNMNFATWSSQADGSTFTIESGATLTLENGSDNINVNVKPGGTLIITGSLTASTSNTYSIVNDGGTVDIDGNVTDYAKIETKNGGVTTVGTLGNWNSIKNTNVTVDAGSTLTVNGDLWEENTAIKSFTNNGTTTVTGKIAIATITNLNSGSISGGTDLTATISLTNSGTINISGIVSSKSTSNSSILTVGSIGKIINVANTISNTGSSAIITVKNYQNMKDDYIQNFSNGAGAKVYFEKGLEINSKNTVANSGSIEVTGNVKIDNGSLTNNGTFTVKKDPTDPTSGNFSINNTGLNVVNNGTLTTAGYVKTTNVTLTNNNKIIANGGIVLDQINACISGSGSVDYWGSITVTSGNTCPIGGFHNLPIELLLFTGQAQTSEIVLSWATASEIQNDYFILEKSISVNDFSTLSTITGAGTSSTKHSYAYSDLNPYYGVNYYRLSQTDFDGQKRYFAPIAVHFSNIEALIYPTVIHGDDIVNVQLSSITEDVPFQIISQDGKILNTGTISNFAELPSDLFQYGLNQLIIGSDNSITTTSIVKQ